MNPQKPASHESIQLHGNANAERTSKRSNIAEHNMLPSEKQRRNFMNYFFVIENSNKPSRNSKIFWLHCGSAHKYKRQFHCDRSGNISHWISVAMSDPWLGWKPPVQNTPCHNEQMRCSFKYLWILIDWKQALPAAQAPCILNDYFILPVNNCVPIATNLQRKKNQLFINHIDNYKLEMVHFATSLLKLIEFNQSIK